LEEMALNSGFDALFDNTEGWKGIREKVEEVNNTEGLYNTEASL
jgi:hypothetical protein